MRVSAIADWTTCEAMALADPRPEARVHVAAWVGTLAHAILLDAAPESWQPRRLRFDATTKTAHEVAVQSLAIAREARQVLDDEGWSIMEAERAVAGDGDTGHLDILAWHGETQRTAIIDLKTGRDIGAGWLQVGGYLALFRSDKVLRTMAYGTPYDASNDVHGGILHVPRVAVSKEPKATLEIRDGYNLMQAWWTARSRYDDVLAGATPLRSPGQHCGRCAVNCPVRI